MSTLAKVGNSWLVAPQNMTEVLQFAKTMSESVFVPKDMRGRPGDVIAAIQYGAELGIAPMAALQNIAVINGRPSVWGDLLEAVILNHPELKEFKKTYDAATKVATCRIVRHHANGVVREIEESFSWAEAEQAGLTKKDLYKQYPKRMLAARARGFAVREAFSDVLKGLYTREEAEDIQPVDIGPATVVPQAPRNALSANASTPTPTPAPQAPQTATLPEGFEARHFTYMYPGNKHRPERNQLGCDIRTLEAKSLMNYIERLEKDLENPDAAWQEKYGPAVRKYLEAACIVTEERTVAEMEAAQKRAEEAAAAGADPKTGEVVDMPDDGYQDPDDPLSDQHAS